jgi:hypothetical protein
MTYLKLPFEIPGYRIVRRLGLGGMATVYLATQESLGRSVAVKVLVSERAPSDDLVKRFENEARTIARLVHPHIVTIFDVGRTSTGQIYYTMPYLPNGDLAGRNLRDSPEQVADIMHALAEALCCAHDHGIVHRDVKPENVLFDKLDRPLLADFGIAYSSAQQPRVTREGATLGSSGYMSPEQARGEPLDGRSDLYSLGVVCYELLTGEMPFRGPDALAIALAHIEKPVPRLPVTRRVWQPLIDRAMAKQPDARFQSAEEMLAAIEVIGKRLRMPAPNRLSRWWLSTLERMLAIPRHRRALALAVLLGALLVVLLALLPQVPEPAATPLSTDAPAQSHTTDAATLPPEQRLLRAADLISINRLVTPLGDNAAQEYLAVLADQPQQPDALRGIERVLGLLAAHVTQAIADRRTAAAVEPLAQGLFVAEQAGLSPGPAYDAFVAPIRAAVVAQREHARSTRDPAPLLALKPLLPTLAKIDPALSRAIEADLALPSAPTRDTRDKDAPPRDSSRVRDAGGPDMLLVPAAQAAANGVDHAFAIAVNEVSRGEWARYVKASGHAAASCRESPRLLARLTRRNWRDPGFAQSDDHPVVCVSWNDAVAYARWLSARSGANYRLATDAEWWFAARAAAAGNGCRASNIGERSNPNARCSDGYEHTAPIGRFAATAPGLNDIAGNVAEWVDICARPGQAPARCRLHRFRGLSWLDKDEESNLDRSDTAADDVGYATVGIRLVRDVPAR